MLESGGDRALILVILALNYPLSKRISRDLQGYLMTSPSKVMIPCEIQVNTICWAYLHPNAPLRAS